MADFSQYEVNLNTPQPGGRQGESPRAAFTKYNDLLGALRQETDHVGPNAPAAPFKAYQRWINTSTVPPSLQIRNAANNDWINAGAAADFQYSRGNIVGTVSESGGVPTGAIIEQGSNSNGRFSRYAGGLQVCWHTHTESLAWEAYGTGTGLYKTDPAIWVYPASFVGVPAVSSMVDPDIIEMLVVLNADTEAAVSYRAVGPPNPNGTLLRTFHSIAIGRWF